MALEAKYDLVDEPWVTAAGDEEEGRGSELFYSPDQVSNLSHGVPVVHHATTS